MAKFLITVKPGSTQEKIIKNDDGSLTIYLRAKAHDNEANDSLIKLISKTYNIPKTTIKITRGLKSRIKTIEF